MNKWLVILTLAAAAPMLSAKSYTVTLATPSIVRNVQLTPGDYHIKLDGSSAIFTDENGNHYTASVNVQQAPQKFAETEVETTRVGGQDRVEEIRLSGTHMKLEFN